MDENTPSTNEKPTTQSTTVMASQDESAAVKMESPSTTGTEHRQAYGTAKTEYLRDSGLWRFLLPAFVVLLCLALLALPLLILGPLLYGSLTTQQHVQLSWVWIVMVVIEVGTAAVIIWGLVKIFMTQAGNYH